MARVLVIGGGIAGCALALFLHKAGIEAVVFEAHPYSRGAGGGLQLATNGMNVLAELGLADALAARGTACHGMEFRDRRGRRLGRLELPSNGRSAVTVSRTVLHELLQDAARACGIAIVHGKRLVDWQEGPGSVVASFADGSSAEGDLLVGADGLQSRVRQRLLPDGPKPAFTGLVGTGGFVPRAALRAAGLVDESSMTLFYGAGAFVGCAYADRREESGGLWWTSLARDVPLESTERAQLAGEEGIRSVLGAGDGWNEAVRQVLGATVETVAPIDIFDVATLPSWSRGRVVLMGDAAHAVSPHSGQGASMALEDSITLAKLLRSDGVGDPTQSFTAFERERRVRVERIVAFGRRSGDSKRRGVVGAWLQAQLMRLFLHLHQPDMGWIYAHRVAW
jgi:2-polyprenyl-6-methoxyphenol hydroxylase-like FAD-dependent oxidoreductase